MSESPSNCVAKASGQNVNKVNTKVHLVLPLTAIDGITEDERYQERNREIALARLENRIVQALVIPKKRKSTKSTKASNV